MALVVVRSHRMEDLVGSLVERLDAGRPEGEALASDLVVVQSPATAQWLRARIAERAGICAGIDIVFPQGLAVRIQEAVFGDEAPPLWEEGTVTLCALDVLRDRIEVPAFAPALRYVGGDPTGPRAVALARRFAERVGRYAARAPHILERWRDPRRNSSWQAALFREVRSRLGDVDPVEVRQRLVERLHAGEGKGLPPRVFVFGVSQLREPTVGVLEALGERAEVVLLVFSPARGLAGGGVLHPLVEVCAVDARAFQQALAERVPPEQWQDASGPGAEEEQDGGTVLRRLQRAVVEGVPVDEQPADEHERSVELHACAGLRRQVEVLHDQLLHAFSEMPDLQPRDVVVLTPRLEEAAPHIEAVFARAVNSEGQRVPFRIAGREIARASEVFGALDALLRLPQSRPTLAEVFDVLRYAPVARRFALDPEAADEWVEWFRKAGARCDFDGGTRKRRLETKCPLEDFTLGWAEKRLLLGAALGEVEHLADGLAPAAAPAGTRSEEFGRALAFLRAAREWVTEATATQARPLDEWVERLRALADRFLDAPGDEAVDLGRYLALLDDLEADARRAGFDGALSFGAVRDLVAWRLDALARREGYALGPVTIAPMMPLRGVPHRVVCLLGIDEDAFPRKAQRASDDEAAHDTGGRGGLEGRDEDRGLFLEALLAARDRLIVVFGGRCPRTGERLARSQTIEDLLDALAPLAPGCDAERRFVVEHPLQPFSPDAFREKGRRRPGFDRVAAEAARALEKRLRGGADGSDETPFVAAPLAPPDDLPPPSLGDLEESLAHTSKFFLRRRLQLRLEEADREAEEEVPLESGLREKGALRSFLAARLHAGMEEGTACALARAQGWVPVGSSGERALEEALEEARRFEQALARVRPRGVERKPLPLAVDLPEVGRFAGVVEVFETEGERRLVVDRPSKSRVEETRLRAYLRHLALCAAEETVATWSVTLADEGSGESKRTVPKVRRLQPLDADEARERLRRLCEWLREALARPLPFFPRTSFAYAEKISEGKAEAVAVAEARKTWDGEWSVGERDAWHALAFRAFDPFEADEAPTFAELAREIALRVLKVEVDEAPQGGET